MEYQEDQLEHAQLAFGLATAIVTAKMFVQMEPKTAVSFSNAIDQVKDKLIQNLNEQLDNVDNEDTRMRGNNTIRLIEHLAAQYKDELTSTS